ncbi:MAG: bifunctional riboflavin kinase/FAD synthetase [Clostridia bacterium]|nr:bifunctional riboflavin kinase/FAD synthetase [Clostridia bacterium]
MDVYDLHKMQKEESAVSPLSVALGNFDGVHAGHAALIREAVAYAKAHGIKSAVWTFADGTAALPNKPDARCITSTRDKLALIASLGVDFAFLEEFQAVRGFTPERFVKELLIEKCGAVCAVCGFNFRFGAGGSGDNEALRQLMQPRDCIVVPPVYIGEKLVSSTAIRTLVEDGDMEGAATLLGHPFFITAPVLHGKQLGRTIGIPTINQNFPVGYVIPKNGIYACLVDIVGETFPGVANVGIRPTIENDSHKINCETHIIGYNGWLYGEDIRVSFHCRLRDEMKFEGVEALCKQIHRDIERTLAYFKK